LAVCALAARSGCALAHHAGVLGAPRICITRMRTCGASQTFSIAFSYRDGLHFVCLIGKRRQQNGFELRAIDIGRRCGASVMKEAQNVGGCSRPACGATRRCAGAATSAVATMFIAGSRVTLGINGAKQSLDVSWRYLHPLAALSCAAAAGIGNNAHRRHPPLACETWQAIVTRGTRSWIYRFAWHSLCALR